VNTGKTMKTETLKFTYEDYLKLTTYSDKRYEILEGELYMVPSPNTRHQRISRNLEFILYRFVEERGLGEILYAPYDVILSFTDVTQPDIIYVSKERAEVITEKNIEGAPDLVIEILSPSSQERDRDIKKKVYAKAGVREYWIVDPEEKAVEVYRMGKKGYTLSGRFFDKLTSSTFPGLVINLLEIFV